MTIVWLIICNESHTIVSARTKEEALKKFFALCMLSPKELKRKAGDGHLPGPYAENRLLGGSVYEWLSDEAIKNPSDHGGVLATKDPVVSGKCQVTLDRQSWDMPSPYTKENFDRREFMIKELPEIVVISGHDS